MSKIAKQPIEIGSVETKIADGVISVKGKLGSMQLDIHPLVEISQEDNSILCRARNDSKESRALSGTFRALIQNMVTGTSQGFEKKLNLVGVGYRAKVSGKKLSLTLGHSHPIEYTAPETITIETPSQTEIILKSYDKQQLGQAAANIRAFRKPDAYKGKGVRFEGEQLRLKETKKT